MLLRQGERGFFELIWLRWVLAARRTEGRPLPGAEGWSLDYGRRCHGVVIAFVLAWAALIGAFVAVCWGDPAEMIAWLTVFSIPLLLVLWSLADTWLARVRVGEEGIEFRYPWRPTARIGWDQIERITYSESWRWFIIRRRRGWRFHLPVTRDGLGVLRSHLRRHVEPIRWATVAGQLPRLPDEEFRGQSPKYSG